MIELALRTRKVMSYDEALLYCQFLDYDGHKDWRLPTWVEYNEYSSLYGWYVNRSPGSFPYYSVTPVRDI
jgi:hypothetical protein